MTGQDLIGAPGGTIGGTLARAIGAAGLVLALAACDGAKKQLGLTKQSPDEFRVVARAPLTLPPDFALRPPEPGATRPQEGSASQQARRAVFRTGSETAETPDAAAAPGGAGGAPDGMSPGERSLLQAAGALEVDPAIRALVNRESQSLRDDRGFLQALVFWREEEPPGVVVDADAEARRLRGNAALGKDVTEGETPTIERREKALFEGLF